MEEGEKGPVQDGGDGHKCSLDRESDVRDVDHDQLLFQAERHILIVHSTKELELAVNALALVVLRNQ